MHVGLDKCRKDKLSLYSLYCDTDSKDKRQKCLISLNAIEVGEVQAFGSVFSVLE